MTKVRKHPHSGKQGAEREFIKIVHDLSGAHSHRQVFDDFLELAFCAIAKSTYRPEHERAAALERRYMETVERRDPEYIRAMPKLLGIAAAVLGSGHGGDFLGRISGELGALSSHSGQFFTPYEVSLLMARMTLADVGKEIGRKGFVTLHEPASGAGGMILAAAHVIEDIGFDPHLQMYVQAVDVSGTAFLMTYLQLALRGIPATVIHGNTLSLEQYAAEITPAQLAFGAHHRERFRRWQRGDAEPAPWAADARGQLSLFAAEAAE